MRCSFKAACRWQPDPSDMIHPPQSQKMRCIICQKLTIEGLVELAKTEFTANAFPRHASFQHHASLADLEYSALLGCDLCEFIRDALAKDIFPSRSSKPLSALEKKTGSRVAVEICINTNHGWNLFSLSQVDMLETLILQIGGGLEGDDTFLAGSGDDDDEVPSLQHGWPTFLKFTLTRPRGKWQFVPSSTSQLHII